LGLPAIKPLLKKKIADPTLFKAQLNPKDPNLIIQDLSITQRYLTKNVFQGNKLSPKESIRDNVDKIRKIQQTNIQMKEKSDEIKKLSEHIDHEHGKLEVARDKFFEDKERFLKTVEERKQ